MSRPWLRRSLKIALWTIALAAIALWATVDFVLPRIAESKIRQAIESQGYGPVRMVRPHVGLYQTTLSGLSVGNAEVPTLQVASATLTYHPTEVVSGQVRDLLVDGLLLHLDASTTGPATPSSLSTTSPGSTTAPIALPATRPVLGTGEPLFRSARLTNARVELVDPETGLPSNILVDAQAKAAADRTIDFSLSAGFGTTRIQIAGKADSDFDVIDADLSVRGLTLDPVRPFVPLPPVHLTRPAEMDARLHVDRSAGSLVQARDVSLRIPGAVADLGNGSALELQDLQFGFDGEIHRYGSDWYAALNRGPILTLRQLRLPPPFQPVPVTLSFAPTHARFGERSFGISSEGATLDVGQKGFGVDLRPFTIASSPAGVVGSINTYLREIEIRRNAVVERLLPAIRDWNVSGRLSGGLSLQIENGQAHPRVFARLNDCDLQNNAYELKVQGINANLSIASFAPLKTDVDQTIAARYIQMGKWEIVNADARFALPGVVRPTLRNDGIPAEGQVIQVSRASFGWAGGDVWCTPFDVNLAQPRIRTELGARDLDLGKILWVVSDKKAYAEGLADLRLWADFSWPELRFGRGWAAARPDWKLGLKEETKGKADSVVLHLPDSAQQLDTWVIRRDPRFQDNPVLAPLRLQLVNSIADFQVDQFRADFSRNPDGKQVTALQLKGAGQAAVRDAQGNIRSLDLTITATDLDILVSQFLKVQKEDTPQ